jgi:hydroxymethylglutaryl-CoA lyase
MDRIPKFAVIEEQALRDGLQAEKKIISTGKKLQLIDALVGAGVKRIQVASFVNPKWVPQMADADQVCSGLKPHRDVVYSGLVLNGKGVERAADAGLKCVSASISASDTHSRRNTGAPLAEARKRFARMVEVGRKLGLTMRGGLQCVFGCRYEGRIDHGIVLDLIKEQLDLGIGEISLADTTGMADPVSIQALCGRAVEIAGDAVVSLHLHDTEGKGLANALTGLQVGIRHFDAAMGGMGGCPFIKGASGNIATGDLVWMLGQMGIETGIDVYKIAAVSRSLEALFAKRFPGKMHHVLDKDVVTV